MQRIRHARMQVSRSLAAAIDMTAVAALVEDMQEARSFDRAGDLVASLARTIGMPVVGWAPDISNPYPHPDVASFHADRGWPEEILSIWWRKRVMLKAPIYLRCRFEHLPFVVELGRQRRRGRPIANEPQRVESLMRAMGLKTQIVVPVHLPRSQVAMLSLAGPLTLAQGRAVMERAGPSLLAAAHHFMRLYGRRTTGHDITQKELLRLTPREWDCLRLLAQGCRESQVAAACAIAPTTVRYHLDNVVRKFGARSRAQAVALAAQLGMLGAVPGPDALAPRGRNRPARDG